MRRDLAQTTFGVLFIVTLIVASLWIVGPFSCRSSGRR